MPTPRSPDFRRGALDVVAQSEPVAATASNLGINESCPRRWMAQDAIDSAKREVLTSAEHAELIELRRKTRLLETEIETLKRASAFARENILPN